MIKLIRSVSELDDPVAAKAEHARLMAEVMRRLPEPEFHKRKL
jgi:hypothetical protein